MFFFRRMNEDRQFWATPSENRIYKFVFPPPVTQVAVQSKSSDDICLIVSVQSPQVGPHYQLVEYFRMDGVTW